MFMFMFMRRRFSQLTSYIGLLFLVSCANFSRQMTSSDTISAVIRCVNFAAMKHRRQRRKDIEETPYINHPIGVAHILTDEAGVRDIAVIQAALLHDTVEDTDTSLDEIKENFGTCVASIVAEVTDDKSLPYEERKKLQIVNAPKSSQEAKLVKLADKLYNLRDLESSIPVDWTKERCEAYFKWAEQVVDGLRGTNTSLERQLDEIFSRNSK